ncbi:hypothetical protein OG349_16285 [Streptomyces sp. NBC_01317]|uniref:hypothetical protein n=1 Tax=Streptomyces sp. NBC_01317 TaxID=2903822 RepID=UPI002E154034|nr:hypothetical protein OG349_16285 [Streptomyces sp. NBC_01317]
MRYSQGWQQVFALSEPVTAAPPPFVESPGLRHTTGPWTSASGTANTLRTNTERSRARLRPAHEGVMAGGRGLSAVAAATAVLASWEERLVAVRDECGYLAGALNQVGRAMGETDTTVRSGLQAIRTAPAVERHERR